MALYRLFIAADLPAEVKEELATTQARLRRANPPVAWVAPGAMHLTLRFLGETSAALALDVQAAMATALVAHTPMSLRLSGVGAFPNDRRPSVLWVGLGGSVAALERAQASIEAALRGLGLVPEPKPFHPHLTLGRVRREASQDQRRQLGEALRALPPPAPLAWTLDRAILFRSELRREGPIYTEIADYRLR
ncbi:MAG TPA: RNA 2',3'-cyclic phosphodiesterase [Roseiflexaceae bacterium]|nr:RNA 2',3'-cyclic phosphodiesterase [Roseiflexaceae bacterium]